MRQAFMGHMYDQKAVRERAALEAASGRLQGAGHSVPALDQQRGPSLPPTMAYSPEIAQAMLQRQQASAIIAARSMIVDGAVGMVEMALQRLETKDIVVLDDERKAAMVSNLLVVLCSEAKASPVVNAGSLYH